MKKKQLGVGRATGKIILMGEHSVVYGEPAIAFPFQKTAVTATITPAEQLSLACSYYTGALAQAPQTLKSIQEVIAQTLFVLKQEHATFSIQIDSTIPAERGMGSSAAVAAAIVRGLFDYFDTPLSHTELLDLVATAEKIAHGNPSGIDAAATSGNSPLFFIKGQSIEAFEMKLENAYLIVADTGMKGQTREAVGDVAQLYKQDPKVADSIAHLGLLSRKAKVAILENCVKELGKLMNAAQLELATLTVSNERLDQLIQVANDQQALGAKLTGGGRGGCLIALTDQLETADKIATALEEAGAVATWIQSLEEND
ncbi:mevalonate kinase [Isobaculum melis]|uniref:Mevalonate kinase n=1 Tax=Isobaculum melis TaxID=142588 RepID=A0A1H9R7M2_9LACT|nr:mevalonate kinase [Isobaculum melis]SER67943.1 mevalonate kinase [Isobaculum melis]